MTPARPVVVHVTTTDMSLDWLLAPQLVAFAEAGYEVIGMSAPGPHVAHLTSLGIRHVPIPAFTRSSSAADDLRATWQLWRAIRRLRPDIVHTHNPKPGVLGRVVARLGGVPLVVNTQHGLYAQQTDRRLRRWAVYGAERLAAAFGHVELVQNPEDVTTLVDRLHVPARRVRLLGNGIDLTRFHPAAADPAARRRLRAEWGVAGDDVVIGAVGRLVAEKGIAELCAAAASLADQGVPARLVVVGPVDEAKPDRVAREAIDAARRAGVVFTGARSDMPECYAAFDVFVTASWREGFPRAAMEAAAMGRAIVATDIRGNRQVVDDGVTGVLVPLRDPSALAGALAALAGDAHRRAVLGDAGRRKALAEFDQATVIARTLAAYASGAAAVPSGG